ncbi:GlxA family transcriptional regulator [Streptomyces sp. NPDC051567]|uniref:GlxA family transcriptional regulator n=1 Tax=Streptomyces sp. NPDC051567 TaxID=3365660 RepID=UPI00378EFB01
MSVVALIVFDGVPAPHLTTPGLMFDAASRSSYHRVPYELRICAASGAGQVATGAPGALRVATPWGLDGLAGAKAVVLAGSEGFRRDPPPGVLDAVRAAAARGSRVRAIGTGVFALAATGLLDGRRATTDWRHTGELALRHPRVDVDLGDRVVADGPFLTSSGVFGGKDLCVRLIEEDHGELPANEADRQLFLMLPDPSDVLGAGRGTGDGRAFGATTRWMEECLDRPPALSDIAAHAGISVRSLNRRFRADTGITPLQYLLRARVRRAQWLLEHSGTPVDLIAARTGLGTPANLRHHFQRFNGTTPVVYQAAFHTLVSVFTTE